MVTMSGELALLGGTPEVTTPDPAVASGRRWRD